MADRIIEANIKKDQAIIEEIIRLLTTILSSWNEAMTTKQNSQPSGRKQKVNAYESNSLYK
jgi:flagellar protein FliS